MSGKKIIALHGFLGHPRDFGNYKDLNIYAPYIFLTQLGPLKQWARRFNSSISHRPILLGYSMGGRLALHCLLQDSFRFKAAIIIAAHPGFREKEIRYLRRYQDYTWSRKFFSLEWDELMNEWNNVPALKGSPVPKRLESNFDRNSLSLAMRYFSLANQEFLIPEINKLDVPIMWIAPEKEQQNIHGLKLAHSQSQLHLVKGSHRLIFEHEQQIIELINKFVEKI
ncbi:MAG: hypothetical protein KC505_10085 [Myxococcales bacterium]|nr:hypothetical protein [Myxococcales bacterium]USN49846.1 MAG: hypothetical protein H6731_06085 [Myxococcales bacterium]